jgi:CheY-like chemotaxis protein
MSDALKGCARAALALTDSLSDLRALPGAYRRCTQDLAEDARLLTKAARWLWRAGGRAVWALRSTMRHRGGQLPGSPAVLGMAELSPLRVFSRARLAYWLGRLGSLFAFVWRPLPMSVPVLERNLFYVVDDDAGAREGLTELLRARGAEVVSFANELALYAAATRRPPSGILLDIVLPWVDGLRLLDGLHRHPATRKTPVYVVSGLDRPYLQKRALAAGARAFLKKPLRGDTLWRALGGAPLTPSRLPHRAESQIGPWAPSGTK